MLITCAFVVLWFLLRNDKNTLPLIRSCAVKRRNETRKKILAMVEVEHSSFVLLYAKLDFTKTYVKLKEMTCVADSFISTNYSFCFAIFYTDCFSYITLLLLIAKQWIQIYRMHRNFIVSCMKRRGTRSIDEFKLIVTSQ